MSEIAFDPIEDLVADIKAGRMVIITDDENRENEGDLVLAAANVTPEAITFMATHARGLICAPLTAERAAEINLSTPASLSDPFGTAFTQSVDARKGTTTGISAFDRARTVRTLIDPAASAADFVSPGHLFPLIARPGGVLLYSTCTVLPEENQEIIHVFLSRHPEFRRETFTLPGPVGLCDGEATLWPQRLGTDGFYICRMRRKA